MCCFKKISSLVSQVFFQQFLIFFKLVFSFWQIARLQEFFNLHIVEDYYMMPSMDGWWDGWMDGWMEKVSWHPLLYVIAALKLFVWLMWRMWCNEGYEMTVNPIRWENGMERNCYEKSLQKYILIHAYWWITCTK